MFAYFRQSYSSGRQRILTLLLIDHFICRRHRQKLTHHHAVPGAFFFCFRDKLRNVMLTFSLDTSSSTSTHNPSTSSRFKNRPPADLIS
mmetsp:Transcript_18139/g.51651  ORF Transcript_18139/g.51651 Transcript_18139/m.51651 type:complete len:89 (+) Transcript_18139:2118-2384(+)